MPKSSATAKHGEVAIVLLGGCSIAVNGHIMPGVPSNLFRLTAYLFLAGAHQSASRNRLSALLWPDVDSSRASSNLRQILARIRRFQADHDVYLIESNFNSVYIVQGSGINCDLRNFLELSKEQSVHAAPMLARHYGGDLLADLGESGPDFEEWLAEQRERLRNIFLDRMTAAIAPSSELTSEERGECARTILAIEPYSEEAYRVLMNDAAAHGNFLRLRSLYESCERHLVAGLGVKPSQETQALYSKLSNALSN